MKFRKEKYLVLFSMAVILLSSCDFFNIPADDTYEEIELEGLDNIGHFYAFPVQKSDYEECSKFEWTINGEPIPMRNT